MQEIRSVAFASDYLRFRPAQSGIVSGQTRNVAWLRELIGELPVWREHGISITTPATTDYFRALRARSGRTSVWYDYNRDPELAWAKRYDIDECKECVDFFDTVATHDLVIGFELPPTLKRHLDRRGCSYISLYVHPLRFLRDLVFGVTTNSLVISSLLRTIEVDDAEVSIQVRRFRAAFAKHQLAAVSVPTDVPLIAEQTERDSVLIARSKFAAWTEYVESLEAQLASYAEVIVLEHPMRASRSNLGHFLRDSLGKTVVQTNANAYGALFAEHRAPLLISLSSSLGVEAAAAGIPAHFLLADPREKLHLAGVDVDEMRGVGHGLLQPQFWCSLLEQPSRRAAKFRTKNAFELGEHYLRDSLGAWAYAPLRSGALPSLRSRKVVVPAASLDAGRRRELLARLAGADSIADPEPEATVIAAAMQRGVELQIDAAPPPPIKPGETITLGFHDRGAQSHLLSGFHPPEPWGCWSGSMTASVQFAVAPASAAAGAWLSIDLPVRVMDDLLAHAPVLRIAQSGRVLAYVFFRPGSENPVDIHLRVPAKPPVCRLDFEISRLYVPGNAERQDRRALGFALTGLTASCEVDRSGESPRLDASVLVAGVASARRRPLFPASPTPDRVSP